METQKVTDILTVVENLERTGNQLSAHYLPDGTFLHLVVAGESDYELTTWSGKPASEVTWGADDFDKVFIDTLDLTNRPVTDYFPQLGAYEILLVHRACNNLILGSQPMIFVQSCPEGFTLPDAGITYVNDGIFPIVIRSLTMIPIEELKTMLANDPDALDIPLEMAYNQCLRGIAVVDRDERKMYIRENRNISQMAYLRNNWRNKYHACLRRGLRDMHDFVKINPQLADFANKVEKIIELSGLMSNERVAAEAYRFIKMHDSDPEYNSLVNTVCVLRLISADDRPFAGLKQLYGCHNFEEGSFADLVEFVYNFEYENVLNFFVDLETKIEQENNVQTKQRTRQKGSNSKGPSTPKHQGPNKKQYRKPKNTAVHAN